MTHLVLVRHCQSSSELQAGSEEVVRDEDDALSAFGIEQAAALGQHLYERFPRARIISSPLRRAWETTLRIAAAYGLEPEIDVRLGERVFAFPAGTTKADSSVLQEESYLKPERIPSGGESVAQHRARAAAWLNALEKSLQQAAPMTFVVVTHGGTIEHLQCCLSGSPLSFMSRMFTACQTGHYHLWTVFRPHDERLVWRLDGIDLGP